MASMLLDDRSGRIEVTLFSDACETYGELLTSDRVVVVIGNLSHDEYRGGLSIRVDQVAEFEQVRAASAGSITLKLNERGLSDRKMSLSDYILELEHILTAYRGGNCPLRISYQANGARAVLAFGDDWRVQPTDELIRRLERLARPGRVEVKYSQSANQRALPEQAM